VLCISLLAPFGDRQKNREGKGQGNLRWERKRRQWFPGNEEG
jgi:hypothetical protein